MDREAELYVLLAQLDLKAIRALREGDAARVSALNEQSESLRTELRSIQDAAANLNQ